MTDTVNLSVVQPHRRFLNIPRDSCRWPFSHPSLCTVLRADRGRCHRDLDCFGSISQWNQMDTSIWTLTPGPRYDRGVYYIYVCKTERAVKWGKAAVDKLLTLLQWLPFTDDGMTQRRWQCCHSVKERARGGQWGRSVLWLICRGNRQIKQTEGGSRDSHLTASTVQTQTLTAAVP